jgi:hypothetical protein
MCREHNYVLFGDRPSSPGRLFYEYGKGSEVSDLEAVLRLLQIADLATRLVARLRHKRSRR